MAATVIIPGRGVVLAKIESTYGTDSTPGASDVKYVEDFEANFTQDPIDRGGIQPETNGLMSVNGTGHVTWSCSVEIDMQAITAGVGDSEAGEADEWFRCAGWARTDDATDKTMTYTLASQETESVTIYAYWRDAGNADCNLLKIVGARASATIELIPGQRVMMKLDGLGIAQALSQTAQQESDNVINETGAALPTVTYPSTSPMLGHKAVTRIITDVGTAAATVYGGNTGANILAGTPNNEILSKSLIINTNMNPVELMGHSANQGVAKIGLRPQGPPDFDLVLEAAPLDDFNPYAARAGMAPMEINQIYTQPGAGNSGNTMQVVGFGQIVGDIDFGETEDSKTWGFKCPLRYPPDADDDPTVGLKPSNGISTSSDANSRGVDNDTTALPASKLAIQFATA